MPKGLLGKKIGMSQYFSDTGDSIAVTFIEAGPCTALQVKTKDIDGYAGVQLGFDKKTVKSTNKPKMGHFKKANSEPRRFIKEVPIEQNEEIKQGQQFFVDIFAQGDFVDVRGLSIGKGFQGGVKRWHWRGGPRSHGSMFHRAPGTIQSNPRLTKVTPGHHLPGHMGYDWVTVQNLEVVEIDKEKNLLILKGAVPGPDGNYLIISRSIKGKKKVERKPIAAGEGKQKVKKPAVKKPAAKK